MLTPVRGHTTLPGSQKSSGRKGQGSIYHCFCQTNPPLPQKQRSKARTNSQCKQPVGECVSASGKPVLMIIQTTFLSQAGGRPGDCVGTSPPTKQQEEAAPTQGCVSQLPTLCISQSLTASKTEPHASCCLPLQVSRKWRC